MSGPARSSPRQYVGWTAVSHGLNAGTNVLLILLLARSLPVRDFGVIAMGLAFLPLVVAGLRGFVFEPAVVHGDLSGGSTRRLLADSAVAGLGVGACLVATVVALRGPLLLAGILFVGAAATVVQEGARWVLFGRDRPRAGAGLDILWAVVQAGGLLLATSSATVAATAWTAGAVASAAAGYVALSRQTYSTGGGRTKRVWQWGLEYIVAAGALQLAVLLAPIAGGVEIASGLRGAMSLLGVSAVILGGAQQAVAGRLRWLDDTDSLHRWGVLTGLGLGLLVALASVPFLAIGDSLGRQLLGETWPATRVVLPALVVQRIATAMACGPAFVLRKRAGHTTGLRWRLLLTTLTLVGVLIGGATGSELGAAWALAIGAIVSVPIWAGMLRQSLSEHPSVAGAVAE
jgi:O-antigen/teichoic acid export membrane protein